MAMIADHFIINVARRVRAPTEPFGPYHEHHFSVELPVGRTRLQAKEVFIELMGKYPEPDYLVSLTSVVCRGSQLCASS